MLYNVVVVAGIWATFAWVAYASGLFHKTPVTALAATERDKAWKAAERLKKMREKRV